MKQLTVNITDEKFPFFIELVESMDFVNVLNDDIPQEHKNIIDDRLEKIKNNSDRLMDWNKVKHQIKY